MTKTISVSLASVLVLVVLVLFAGVAVASHSWSKYHWDLSTADTTENPLRIGDNLTSTTWKGSLVLASDDWNESVIKNQVVTGSSNANCDPTLGQVEVCNNTYGQNGWLGIAQVWAYRGKDGHIAQAIVKLNDTYFNTAPYNTTPWRNLVMCQEVGHTFGLGHQDENFVNTNLGTCMDYTNDPDGLVNGQLNNEHPNTHDFDMLRDIYAHLNGSSVDDGTNDTGKRGKGNGRNRSTRGSTFGEEREWGTPVAQDASGRNSRYVRDLGNRMELITHVLWVPGDSEGVHDHDHDDARAQRANNRSSLR